MASTKNKKASTEILRNSCTCCGANNSKDFYKSFNPIQKQTQQLSVCKSCVEIEFQKYLGKYQDGKLAMYYLCRKFDIFFCVNAYEGAVNNSATTGWTIIQSYFKQINSFRNEDYVSKNGYLITFDESFDFLDRVLLENSNDNEIKSTKKEKTPINFSDSDKQNQNDVIRLLKYDPFIDESYEIKGFLYNKLIDFLDENTLNDSFKLPIVIEIVKGFGQAEKINKALSQIDITNDMTKIKDIKILSDTRNDILRVTLTMAKDNGISENYSNNKSKGAGTLSGIIKDLQEKGIRDAEVNLYDIETCSGMKQVADISNKSIIQQLMLNENDYVDMIKDQKQLIQDLDDKSIKLEEDNRLLKLKLKGLESYLKDNKILRDEV